MVIIRLVIIFTMVSINTYFYIIFKNANLTYIKVFKYLFSYSIKVYNVIVLINSRFSRGGTDKNGGGARNTNFIKGINVFFIQIFCF